MKTYATREKDIKRAWHLIDAEDQVLGRLVSNIAPLLVGKNKVYFTPHLDCGDWVVVINAGRVRVTGKKEKQKLYRHHTGFPGGLRELTFSQLMAKDPRKVIVLAVKGMLPKNKLRSRRLERLRIFVNEKHPYQDKFKDKNAKKE